MSVDASPSTLYLAIGDGVVDSPENYETSVDNGTFQSFSVHRAEKIAANTTYKARFKTAGSGANVVRQEISALAVESGRLLPPDGIKVILIFKLARAGTFLALSFL